MRVVDVWDSAEAFGRFAQEQLGPAAAEVVGGEPRAPEPELYDVQTA